MLTKHSRKMLPIRKEERWLEMRRKIREEAERKKEA